MEDYLSQITNYLLTQSWQIVVLVVVIGIFGIRLQGELLTAFRLRHIKIIKCTGIMYSWNTGIHKVGNIDIAFAGVFACGNHFYCGTDQCKLFQGFIC